MKKNALINIDHEQDIDKLVDSFEIAQEKDLDAYLRISFLLLDFLVNSQYTEKEHNYYAGVLKKYFLESYQKYLHCPEYLFYIGFISSMAEWYFDMNIEEVRYMIKEAEQLEPQNILYKWGYYFIIDQRNEINTILKHQLSKQILENKSLIKGIRRKGLLGMYLEGMIQYTYKSTSDILHKF